MGAATAERPADTDTKGSDIPPVDESARVSSAEAAAAEPESPTPADKQPTERYVFVSADDKGSAWSPVVGADGQPAVYAGNESAALKEAYKRLLSVATEDEPVGQVRLVAVPVRSFRPKTVGAEPREPVIAIG